MQLPDDCAVFSRLRCLRVFSVALFLLLATGQTFTFTSTSTFDYITAFLVCSSKRTFVQFKKWLKPSSYVHLNTSTILHLWFNYFNWQLYMQRHTWIRNLDEYRKGQGERNSGTLSFNEGDDTGRNNQDSDSASLSDSWVWQWRQCGWSFMTV